MWEIIQYIPMAVTGTMIAWICWECHKWNVRRDRLWDEEVERQQKVKNLYPDPPSYEERMGVRYGPKKCPHGCIFVPGTDHLHGDCRMPERDDCYLNWRDRCRTTTKS